MAQGNVDVKNHIILENFDDRIAEGPPRIQVSVQMHAFHRMIVSALELDLPEGTAKFIAGIKLYVFLGAMFECWATEFLRRYLESRREVPVELFGAIERQQLKNKIDFIRGKVGGDWWLDGVQVIQRVADMRNRLLHFKDQPTVGDVGAISITAKGGVVTGADLLNGIREAVPNPRIYDEIADENLKELREKALELYGKLSALEPPSP